MPQRRNLCTVVVLILLGLSRSVAADPARPCTPSEPCHLRMREETTLTKDNGSQYRLPPGRFLDEDTFVQLDQEMHRLQDQETRLTAENKSLRTSLEGWKPGWWTITTALLIGLAGGVGGYYYFEHR